MIASGHRIAITAARDELKLLGSDEGPNLLTGPTALVAARNRLRAGGRVHSAPDGLSEHPKWRRVETPAGPRWISGAMARVAEAMKVPVFFAAGALDEKWNVVITIEKPIGSKAADVMNEYVEFFQRRLELKR